MSANPQTLAEKIVALHHALRNGELAHAFGGALALAYCTKEPRATRDIDVNIFASPDDIEVVASGLPPGVLMTEKNRRELSSDGQSRLWWDDTPVDIFLSNHSFHGQVEQNRRFVSFAEVHDLPVLACSDLGVFKAFFGRAKDAIDIAAMAGAKAINLDQLEHDVAELLGSGDERSAFFALVRSAVTDYE